MAKKFGGMACLTTDANSALVKSAITKYKARIVERASLLRRAIAIMPAMLLRDEPNNEDTTPAKCKLKTTDTKLTKLRTWAKAEKDIGGENGNKIINDLYKYEIKAKQIYMRIFRHVMIVILSGTGGTDPTATDYAFKIKKATFDSLKTDLQGYLKSLGGMRSKVWKFMEKYLEKFGNSACVKVERNEDAEKTLKANTDQKYLQRIKGLIKENMAEFCKDSTADSGEGDGDCDKTEANPFSNLTTGTNKMFFEDGSKFAITEIAGAGNGKTDTVEQPSRRLLAGEGEITSEAAVTDATTTEDKQKQKELTAANTSDDKITIGDVDADGKCAEGESKCAIPVPVTTSTDGEDGEVSVTTSSISSFMTYGFGFFAVLVAAINLF